jgi:hypothetical protein
LKRGEKKIDFMTNFGIYKGNRSFGCLTGPHGGHATGPAKTKTKTICFEVGMANTFKNPVPT